MFAVSVSGLCATAVNARFIANQLSIYCCEILGRKKIDFFQNSCKLISKLKRIHYLYIKLRAKHAVQINVFSRKVQ